MFLIYFIIQKNCFFFLLSLGEICEISEKYDCKKKKKEDILEQNVWKSEAVFGSGWYMSRNRNMNSAVDLYHKTDRNCRFFYRFKAVGWITGHQTNFVIFYRKKTASYNRFWTRFCFSECSIFHHHFWNQDLVPDCRKIVSQQPPEVIQK